MGFNTVVVLFNDMTHEIRRDGGAIGERIATAMTSGWSLRSRDRLATWFGCGQVVSQAHADYSQVVVCGKNSGKPIVDCNDLDHCALAQIADALRRHGWKVTSPRKSRKAKSNRGAPNEESPSNEEVVVP